MINEGNRIFRSPLSGESEAGIVDSAGSGANSSKDDGEPIKGDIGPGSSGGRKNSSKAQIEAAQAEFESLDLAGKEQYIEESATEGLIFVNAFKIERLYPKAYASLKDHVKRKLNLPNVDHMMTGILLYGSRAVLYEFFDEEKVYINVIGSDISWYYTLDSARKSHTSGMTYKSRIEAEQAAFEAAFEGAFEGAFEILNII